MKCWRLLKILKVLGSWPIKVPIKKAERNICQAEA
jgi:hypothetical protein